MANDLIITATEVSVYLKLPLTTVYKLASEGKLPAFKIGKHWRFRRDEIEALTTAHNKPAGTAENSSETNT